MSENCKERGGDAVASSTSYEQFTAKISKLSRKDYCGGGLTIMIILGIDPGLATIGFGIIEKQNKNLTCIDFGIISTSQKQETGERLNKIFTEITKLIKKHCPDVVVVENLFFFKNLKTAMPVSEARGVILLAIAKKKIQIEQLTPLQVKMGICGYGRADKKQVQKMVKEILEFEKIPKPDDAADALAIAICWANYNKMLKGG